MKILYVSTISNTVNAFLIPHIEMLLDEGHEVAVAFKTENDVNTKLYDMGCKVYELPFNRSPLNKGNLLAYKLLKDLILKERYDLVHTHTPVASAIVRLVCKNIYFVKIIYTAHGFHFYKGAPLKNWLLYYPLEKKLARYTDVLITINSEDYKRAQKNFKSKQIDYIPGVGLDIERISNIFVDRCTKRKELGIPKDSFLILSVGELNKNKNHKVIIEALKLINNSNIHYIICGIGPLEEQTRNLANELGLGKNVHLLGFRRDIEEIYKIADVFVFPSYREGLPRSVMEAMASGLPCIVSKTRGNIDLIENESGGFLCNPDSKEEFAKSINKLFNNKKLCKDIIVNNQEVINSFSQKRVNVKLREIYRKI